MKNVVKAAENWAKEMPEGKSVVLITLEGLKQSTYIYGRRIDLKASIMAALIEDPELFQLVKDAIMAATFIKARKEDPSQLLDLDDIENLPEEFKSTKK